MREFTANELAACAGEAGTPLYLSAKGVVFDVTSGADFYGPGAGYHIFAGKDASRPLGKMVISDAEANASWENLSPEHAKVLDDWVAKFQAKYPVVGRFVPDADFVARGNAFDP